MAWQEELLHEAHWKVNRTGTMKEVHKGNGSIAYKVEIADDGRKPFVTRWFNDITPAIDFLDDFMDPVKKG